MRKRTVAILCALALVLSMIPAAAPVATAASTTDTPASTGVFKVGYAKICINPANNVAYPLGGYDSGVGRVPSDGIADYMDDNGDGSVVAGIGGKLYASNVALDGLYATAIAMQDANGNASIFIGVDAISLGSDVVLDYSIDGVIYSGAQTMIVNAAKEAGYNLQPSAILVNASHSHSGVIMNGDATLPYRESLRGWLRDVAMAALSDLKPATIYRGQAATQNMNFVRHYNDSDSDTSAADVGGDNTSVWLDGQYVSSYLDCDPNIYMLRFTQTGGKDIILANWRAHPKCNSTATHAFGVAHRSYTSSDYINAFRYNLEKSGYSVAFFQGAAGNINTYTDVYGGLGGTSVNSKNPTNRATITTYSNRQCQTGNLYGKKLAEYATTGLSSMTKVTPGAIRSSSYKQWADRDMSKKQLYDQVNGITVKTALASSSYNTSNITASSTYASMSVLQFLADYWNYSGLYNASADKVTSDTTAIKNIVSILQKTYKINSKYHLNTLYAQKDRTGGQGNTYLFTVSIGSSIAIIAAAFETFDYNYNPQLNAEALAGLDSSYGMPFVFGYTNRGDGYMPAEYAFSVAYTGSYEVNQTNYAKGTAELIHDKLISMVNNHQTGPTEKCTHCNKVVDWYNWDPRNTTAVPSGHYFLAEDFTTNENWQKLVTGSICLHLNGHTYSNGSDITGRAFAVKNGGTLNLMGTGTVQGRGITTPANGGVILVNGGGTVNVYSGVTIKLEDHSSDATPQIAYRGGLFYIDPNGTFNLRGGTLTAGIATSTDTLNGDGGAIYNLGTFEMFSGTISGCKAGRFGGAVFNNATFNMHGGIITGGSAVSGGALFNAAEGISTIHAGTINGSTVTDHGGAVYSSGTLNMNKGTISGGSANNGGSVYITGAFTMNNGTISGGSANNGGSVYNVGSIIMNNGTITGGAATNDGGTMYIAGGHKTTMNNGTITMGTADRYGGNMWVSGTFEMNGGTVSNGTDSGLAHNILVADQMDFNGGKVISDKTGKSIRVNSVADLNLSGNATVDGGTVALQYYDSNLANLNLAAPYYGDAVILVESNAAANVVLGEVAEGAAMKENSLTYSGGSYSIAIDGTNLILTKKQSAPIKYRLVAADGTLGKAYTNMEDTLANYDAADGGFILVMRDAQEGTFAYVTEDVYVQMASKSMNVVVADGVAFHGMERVTDDFVLSESETCGVLTVYDGTPAVETTYGENRYLALPGTDGTYTFHAISLDTKKGLRPYNETNGTGLYFQPYFQADQVVAEAINNGTIDYGVLMTMDKTADGGAKIPLYQTLGAYAFETGSDNSSLRVVLYGMMPNNEASAAHEGYETMEAYWAKYDISKYPVTGQACFKIGDAYVTDDADQTISLREAIYKVDKLYPSMSENSAQKIGLDKMWQNYNKVLRSWADKVDGGVNNGLVNIGSIKIDISDWFQ